MHFIPIGFVRSAYQQTSDVPKGFGARHDAEGVLDVQPEFEDGLTDIEGFSHLYVIWVFDRLDGCELLGVPPTDDRPHGVFATRSPRRPNPIGLTVVELLRRDGSACTCAASTCSTARRSSTSSRICRACQPRPFGGVGWPRRSTGRQEP